MGSCGRLVAAVAVLSAVVGQEAVLPEVSYEDFRLLRVQVADQAQLKSVFRLADVQEGVQVWATHNGSAQVDLLSAPFAWDAVRSGLANAGINYFVMIENLQDSIRRENPPMEPEEEEWENRSGHRLTWKRYHPFKDIEGYVDYLANTYPEICQMEVIGQSSEGRPLKVLKISTGGKKKPAVWIDGGIHAREWISPATVTYLLLQLVEFRHDHPSLIDDLDWYVLPVVNPDGYEYSHTTDRLWRKTRSSSADGGCVGVDANRNFDVHWAQVGSSINPCREIYAGSRPFSEPETKAVSDFILSHKDEIKVYLTMHSYGQVWLVPWGYKAEKPQDYYDMYVLAEQGVEALERVRGTDYLLGTADELIYVSSGGSDDWAKEKAGIKYAYTVELPDTGRYGFVLPASEIEPVGQEVWEGVKSMMLYFVREIGNSS
ncbi:carboxypeptidase B-like [Neocloeon triangulifer]|uniref:carboxypeptidase B-like n=1 Tax=Neocloeon triangulifer TaxID=2078957 RepID=UPI00286EFC8F|nr:carboxypeptidase B-like [Neocloeon triangulifer]